MGTEQSNKRGMESDSQKQDNTRHGFDPAPASSHDAGAHGRWNQPPTTAADSKDLMHDVPSGKTGKSSGNA